MQLEGSICDDVVTYMLAKTLWLAMACSMDIREALQLYHVIWIHELQLANVDF